MKTFNKVLCVMLSILMAMSCLSAVAFAADGEKFTSSLKAHSGMSNAQSAKATLDMVDEALAQADIYEEINVKEIVRESLGDLAAALVPTGFVLEFDFRNINALCKTIDEYKLSIEILSSFMGDLRELDLGSWEEDMSRPGDDITIIKEIIELVAANKEVIKKICDGSIDLGILLNSFININDLLGADGVSGILKEALIGFVYDKDSPEFTNAYNTYKNNVDAFIYDVLLPFFTKDYLPGLDLNANSKINDLIMDVYNISFEKYIKEALSTLDFDFSTAEYEELKALHGIVVLDKNNFTDTTGLTYKKDGTPVKDQINTILGNYMKKFVPGFEWNYGGYASLKANIEGSIKYVARESGIVKNADSKTVEQIGVEIALIILKNGDFGNYATGLADCKTLEEMATKLLINTAKEMKLGVEYKGNESYLVVLGDMLASWAYDNFPIKDNDGKDYRPGGGKDVFEVANYFVNYFLFDRAGANVLGLSTSKTEDIFTKLDKLADYFGQNKSVNFSSKNFLLGTTDKKGILDCVFTLDIVGLFDLTAIPALDKAGNVSVVEFLYKTVQYFCNNWAGKPLFPAYDNNPSKPFTNALSNNSIANMISVLLETLNNRKSGVVTLLTYVVALGINGSEKTDYVIDSASVNDIVATGKDLFPTATVKAGGKTLTQNVDYVVVTDTLAPGTATATIKGIGLYSGEIERSLNIKMDKVSTASYTSTASSVTLKWGKVPYADSYMVLRYDSAAKKYITIKSGITGTSYTVTGLASGGEYKYYIKAKNSVVGSTSAKIITTYTLPSAVKSSTVKSTSTASSVSLTWTAVTGATHYKVEKYAGSDKWTNLGTTDKTSFTASGLSGGTTYAFRITALKKVGDKYLASSPITYKAKTVLSAPSSLKAVAATSSITLSWAKVKNAETYEVWQYTGSEWKKIATTAEISYKVKNLSAATEYKFAVFAKGSEYSKSASGKINTCTLPNAVKASGIKTSSSASTVKLSWSKVTGATHYKVEKYVGSGKWTKLTLTDATSYTATGLSGFTNYAFRITAFKKLSNGKYIGSATTTVKAKTTLGTTSSLKASYTDTSIKLTWSKVNNAEKYEVQRYVDGKWKTIKTLTGTSYTVTGLKAATSYKLAVRAVATDNGKAVYGSRKEITQYTGLVKPSSVKASSITATSAKITWSKVSKAETYEVYAYIGGEWIKKGSTKNLSLTIKELPSGTKTKVKVRAVAKLGGKTTYGTYSSTITVLTTVGKVTSLKASVRKTDSITLSWKKTTGATSYEVYQLVNGSWKKLGTTTSTSYTVKSLKRSTEYKFKVRAVQKIDSKTTRYGEYSSQLKAKTTLIGTAKS